MITNTCIVCGAEIPEDRRVCPNCEKQKPMKNLSNGEMVQIAEGKKNKTPRYIDANKLIDLATHEGAYGYVDVHDIYNVPTADVVERKKGKWIKKMRIIETDKYASFTPEWYCSCCGEGYAPYIAELISFCPNCGADMREEKTDG